MTFSIQFAASAARQLAALDARRRSAISGAIGTHLRHEPMKESRSRIKRLTEIKSPQYRLRVGEFRVFYDVEGNVVSIVAIVAKSDAEQWLEENAEKTDDSNSVE